MNTTPTTIRRKLALAWIGVSAVAAFALLALLVAALATAGYLVDVIPGADAGLATSPALDAARNTAGWSAVALVAVVGVGVLGLVLHRRRSRTAGRGD